VAGASKLVHHLLAFLGLGGSGKSTLIKYLAAQKCCLQGGRAAPSQVELLVMDMRMSSNFFENHQSTSLTLSSDEVHVWYASLSQPMPDIQRLAQTLSEDEHSRAERFYFERDRNHFITGRGILRSILSRYLGVKPEQLRFNYGPYGKPALTETPGGDTLRFNVSHSAGFALYAVTYNREIGVDIERIRPISEIEQIAERFFSAREWAAIRALPPSQRQEAFFSYWTCKEALMKALGDGLFRSLDQVEVSASPNEPAKLLNIDGASQAVARWSLLKLTPPAGYAAALAIEKHNWRLEYRFWTP